MMFLKIVLTCLFANICLGAEILVDIDRSLESVRPDQDLVGFEISLTEEGQPIEHAALNVKLETPNTSLLTSTDFPHVEGTTLINGTISLTDGKFKFSTVLPIRGDYRLLISAKPAGDINEVTKELRFRIHESPDKVTNLAIFLSFLGTLGLVSGFIIGKGAKPKLRYNVATLTLLFFLLPGSGVAHPLDDKLGVSGVPKEDIEVWGDYKVTLNLDTPNPQVGSLSTIRGSLVNQNLEHVPAIFHLRFVQLEHGQVVFETKITEPSGQFRWEGQFFDGSAHRVELVAFPLGKDQAVLKPKLASVIAEVEGLAPPWHATLKAMVLFLLIVAITLMIGVYIGKRAALEARTI